MAGQRKEDLAAEYVTGHNGTDAFLFIGKAQEKVHTFRTKGRRNARGETYPWIVESTAMVNQYYFYGFDEDCGPFFIKYSPFGIDKRCSDFDYEPSMSQIEFALTQVVDRPVHGRIFFEEVIRENLDLGRPENIQLIWARVPANGSPAA